MLGGWVKVGKEMLLGRGEMRRRWWRWWFAALPAGMGKELGVFDLKGEPFWSGWRVRSVCPVVKSHARGDGSQEKGHAVVVEGGAPLAHGRMDGVEDMKGILFGGGFAGAKLEGVGDGDGRRG